MNRAEHFFYSPQTSRSSPSSSSAALLSAFYSPSFSSSPPPQQPPPQQQNPQPPTRQSNNRTYLCHAPFSTYSDQQEPSPFAMSTTSPNSLHDHLVGEGADGAATVTSSTTTGPRNYVSNACTNCKQAHVGCDAGRPCKRCVRLGKADSCENAAQQKRGWRKGRSRKAASDEKAAAVEAASTLAGIDDQHAIGAKKPRRKTSATSVGSNSSPSSSSSPLSPSSNGTPVPILVSYNGGSSNGGNSNAPMAPLVHPLGDFSSFVPQLNGSGLLPLQHLQQLQQLQSVPLLPVPSTQFSSNINANSAFHRNSTVTPSLSQYAYPMWQQQPQQPDVRPLSTNGVSNGNINVPQALLRPSSQFSQLRPPPPQSMPLPIYTPQLQQPPQQQQQQQQQVMMQQQAAYQRPKPFPEPISRYEVEWTTRMDGEFVQFFDKTGLLGYMPAQLIGKSMFSLIDPSDVPVLDQVLAIAREVDNDVTMLFRFQHIDGTSVWLEGHGRVTADGFIIFRGYPYDASTVKLPELKVDVNVPPMAVKTEMASTAVAVSNYSQQLQQQKPFVFTTEHNIDDVACINVTPDIEKVLGYPSESMLGHFMFSIMHPQDMHYVGAAKQALKTGKKIHCRMRMRLRHFDGYYIWVESHARLLVNAVTRAPESIMCTMKPISFSESYTAKAGTFSCSDQGEDCAPIADKVLHQTAMPPLLKGGAFNMFDDGPLFSGVMIDDYHDAVGVPSFF